MTSKMPPLGSMICLLEIELESRGLRAAEIEKCRNEAEPIWIGCTIASPPLSRQESVPGMPEAIPVTMKFLSTCAE